MGDFSLDENGMIVVKKSAAKTTKERPKIKIIGSDGELTTFDEEMDRLNKQKAAPEQKTTDRNFEINEDGMFVESEAGKKRREEKKQNTPKPKLLILGADGHGNSDLITSEELRAHAEASRKAEEEKAQQRPGDNPNSVYARMKKAKVFKTKDGFFMRELYPGYEKEYRKKEKEREQAEKKRKEEEKRKKKEEERQRKAAEKKKKQEEEKERKRKKKQDEVNKKKGIYAGEGFHYEKREMKNVDGTTNTVKVKVPNDPPKPKFVDDAIEESKADEAQQANSAGEGFHYEEREIQFGDGSKATVKYRLPDIPPRRKYGASETEESDADAKDYGKEGSDNSGFGTGTYVSATATLQCPFGTMTSKLVITPDRTTTMGGKPMANISDFVPLKNIMPFGQCTNPAFPATASATAAAFGVLTPMPCIPNIVAPWVPPKAGFMINGQPALMNYCTCQCLWGGCITIQQDGQ